MKKINRILFFLITTLTIGFGCTPDPEMIYLTPPLVDAGPARTITLPLSFDTLRGTATTYNGSAQGYLWSLVSGPNIPDIQSPSSRSTKVSNLINGVYKFQFAVIDSAGLTGVDTTSITVLPDARPTISLSLQPHNNPNESHILLLGSSTDQSDPTSPEIVAGAWTNGGIPIYIRGVFKFDLSSIPANATILSAKLTLYTNPTPLNGDHVNSNSGIANSMYIERNTSALIAPFNWASQPTTDAASAVLIPHTNAGFLDLTDVDVKTLVAPMVSTNNYGFKIRLQNEIYYNIRNFCSSKHADASKHPKLVVTYR
jgi:hypothetical protein